MKTIKLDHGYTTTVSKDTETKNPFIERTNAVAVALSTYAEHNGLKDDTDTTIAGDMISDILLWVQSRSGLADPRLDALDTLSSAIRHYTAESAHLENGEIGDRSNHLLNIITSTERWIVTERGSRIDPADLLTPITLENCALVDEGTPRHHTCRYPAELYINGALVLAEELEDVEGDLDAIHALLVFRKARREDRKMTDTEIYDKENPNTITQHAKPV